VDLDFTTILLGNIGPGDTPVSMQDNGTIVVLVDGTTKGYWWGLGTTDFNPIIDDAFYGSQRVCYLDGWLIFVRPETAQFYLSPNFWNGTDPFDPTYIASKTGGPDRIISIAVIRGELWLVGALTTEVWYNSGDLDFPFARQPGVLVEHGMERGWSIADADVEIMWLARDTEGQGYVVRTKGYDVERVSNYALEHEIQAYETTNDAQAFFYQQDGHTFYCLVFPTADKWWAMDVASGEWHERTWTDPINGIEHRHRVFCAVNAYNLTVAGDHSNGKLYSWELSTYDDDGAPITRTRDFPHLVKDGKRIEYASFIADMQVGTAPGLLSDDDRDVLLRYSDTRGASWSDWTAIPWGATGEYIESLIWRQLGMARDRVFRLQWSFPYQTALQGAFIDAQGCDD